MQTDTPICRVCRSEGSEEQPLFYPCLCSGSIKYIHQDCLVEWLNHSKKKYCELCKHPFTFSPIYAAQMPERIPLGVLLLGSLKFVAKFVKRALSFLFALFLWSFVVPVISAQIFRYYFGFSLQGLLQLAPLRFAVEFSSPEELQQYVFESTVYLLFDVVQGLLICGFTIFLGIGLLLTRELQAMVRTHPEATDATPRETANSPLGAEPENSPFRSETTLPNGIRFRSSAARNATAGAINSPATADSTPPPPASSMDAPPRPNPSIFSPQTQQLFSEIARLEEALNGSESSDPAAAFSAENQTGGYWLDRVHPKEYKKYVQRSNLQRQLTTTADAENTAPVDESFNLWSSPNFDDHLSNISGTTTLRTNATTRTSSNVDSIRCRICSSTTCINRDHVIQASRLRFASVAARNQALIDEAIEFGDLGRPVSNSTSATTTAQATQPTQPTGRGLPEVTQPAQRTQPQPQPAQAPQDDEWRINLDADTITLAEFFGFSSEGANPLELLQNAAIVAGCNALIMIVFLCIPSLFGSIVLKEASVWNSLISFPSASKVSGFAARLVVGYSVLACLLSFYHSLGKRFFRDAFHRSFLPALAFFGTFCKLVVLLSTEMVVFPIACGLLVNLLTLPLFPESTWIGRLKHFSYLPASFLAIHWALGAAFMLSFATHVSFLRSFCRPGLIYFLRNPSDPDAHPLREMLERSFGDQLYRLGISLLFYAALMTCSIGGAARIVAALPLAPLKYSFAEPLAEAPLGLLLHLTLRWLLARLHPGRVLGRAYRAVAEAVINSVDLSSYFLGKHPQFPGNAKLVAVPNFDRVYSKAAMKEIRDFKPTSFSAMDKPAISTVVYRPNLFLLRCLFVIVAGFLASQLVLSAGYVIPLTVGRWLFPSIENEVFSLFLGFIPVVFVISLLGGHFKSVLSRDSVQKALGFALSFVFAGIVWPVAIGVAFVLITAPLLNAELLVGDAIINASHPLQTAWSVQLDPLNQSIPIVFLTTCWSIGFPLMKVGHMLRNHLPLSRSTLAALDAPANDNLTFLLRIALPVTAMLAAFLALPPLLPVLLVPLLVPEAIDSIQPAQRISHLSVLLTWTVWKLGSWLGGSMGEALANIRDDAYLIGRQLHNLERSETQASPESPQLRERRIPTTPIL